MKYILFIAIIFILSSCEEIKKSENNESFKSEFAFIIGNEDASKLNIYAESNNSSDSFKFIYFVDGGCDLCSLDLSEIENLSKSVFLDYNIKPIVIIMEI